MTEKSYLWTTGGAGDGANTYTRSDWGKIGKILASCRNIEGVSPELLNKLVGSVPAANTVRIGTGGALVDGKPYDNSAAMDVNIPSAVGVGNTRIDRVVLRADWTAQTVRITRIAGTDAITPAAPAITQTSETTYDIMLYQALVNVGGDVTITDERVFAQIGADEITNEMIADDAVQGAQIKDGEITSAKLAQPKPYSCKATRASFQAVANITTVYVNLTAEEFDDDSMHDLVTDNTRITCKRAGRYFVIAEIQTDSYTPAAAHPWMFAVLKNRTTLVCREIVYMPSSPDAQYLKGNFSGYVELAENDYIELNAYQNSGQSINVLLASLSLVWDG